MKKIKQALPGLILAILTGFSAKICGDYFPIIGGPVFGIIFGLAIGNLFKIPSVTEFGLKFTSKKVLQYAIIILGGSLGLGEVIKTGSESIWVMLSTMFIAFLFAYILGKWLKTGFTATSLIGVGTAVCGGSAIAAVAPAINAEDTDIAYSISVIFLFNVIAALVFPPIGHLLGMTQIQFGLWAGTAVNDTSSVVAAAYSYGDIAGNYAVIVKLTRTLMIIPISLVFALIAASRNKNKINHEKNSLIKSIPWFIIGFLIMSLLNTQGIISTENSYLFSKAGKLLITIAMAAIGFNSDFKKIAKSGFKPIFLGFLLWIIVSISSLIVQSISGL